MILDPLQLRQMAEARGPENFRFRNFLKRYSNVSSEEVDELVFQIAERVWKTIDCTACGNCCREVVPTCSEEEVASLAKHIGISDLEFKSKYLQPTECTEERPWVMRERPCPFLKDNRCTVYESRPANCRDYPYLDKSDFTSRTLSMLGRLPRCPAVFEVWEELKRATGFRPQARRKTTSRWHWTG